MEEIEVKILEIDRPQVEKRLTALGATLSFDGEMAALFFDYADQRISTAGSVLRLRKEGPRSVLTHKRPRPTQGAKVMHELETEVGSFDATREILQATGLEVIKSTRKFRTQYDLPEGHVVIDDYQDDLAAIPVFVEIESPNLTDLQTLVLRLGFSLEDTNTWNTYDLVQHYIKG